MLVVAVIHDLISGSDPWLPHSLEACKVPTGATKASALGRAVCSVPAQWSVCSVSGST